MDSSAENPKRKSGVGVLTHKVEEYLKCLELGHRQLQVLMNADCKYWADNLARAKLRAEMLSKHMKNLLERQKSELTEFIDTGKLKPKFGLKRLPMWGQQVNPREINFEWPMASDLDFTMFPDGTLKALQFKTSLSNPAIASVVCVLQSGHNSPVFERANTAMEHSKSKTVTFEA